MIESWDRMGRHRVEVGVSIVNCILIAWAGASGGVARAQNGPTVGNLQMPLVTPQQADQFFASRTVLPSNAPAPAPAAANGGALQSVNVDPVLGHDLPTDAVTPGGFPRADFATAKPSDGSRKDPVGAAAIIGPRGPSTSVIRETPPTVGNP